MRRTPFGVIGNDVSHDTVRCLEWLLSAAKQGQVVGVAYGAILKRQKYALNTCGEAHNNPVLARGIVALLGDELSQLARE